MATEHQLRKWLSPRLQRGLPVTGTQLCRGCNLEKHVLYFSVGSLKVCRDCHREFDRIKNEPDAAILERRRSSAAWKARHSKAHSQWWEYTIHRRKYNLPILGAPDVCLDSLVWLYGPDCQYCASPLRLDGAAFVPGKAHCDHIIPVTHPDSSHSYWNLISVCVRCNRTKRTQSLEKFLGPSRAAHIQRMIADAAPRFEQAKLFAY